MVPAYSHGAVGWRRREEDDGVLQGSGDEDAPPPLRQETGLTHQTLDSTVTDATCQTGYTESTVEPANGTVSAPHLGLDGETSLPLRPSPAMQIKQDLSAIQISLIVVSGTIGLGLFTDSGEILRIAGPGGALVAFSVVGICVIFVMLGVAEMISHWPIPGALVEFIKTFVDKDLGLVLGLAYWFAYAVTFGTLFSALLDLGKYWVWDTTWRVLVLAFILPVVAIAINVQRVKVFGFIESIMGAIKLLLVAGAFTTMCVINAGVDVAPRIGSKYISDGFQSDHRITTSPFIALLVAIPIATYAFAGVEIIAVAALESKSPRALRWPAKYVTVIITSTYLLSVFGFCLNVSWQDPSLPSMSNRATGGTTTGASILIIAAKNSGIPGLAGFLNGCLILTVFSAANTTLYVASRTLYGLCRDINPHGWAWRKWVRSIGVTHPTSCVPVRAVFMSLLPGVWLPWVHTSGNDQSFQEIMSGIATVSIILVWGAQCLAFMRYRMWLSRHDGMLHTHFAQYSAKKLASNDVLSHLQPVPAAIGLCGCLITVLGFSTASWWQWGKPSPSSVLAAFLMPGLIVLCWVILKLASPEGFRSLFSLSSNLSDRFEELAETLTNLEGMIQENPSGEYQNLAQSTRPRWELTPPRASGQSGPEPEISQP